MNLHGTQLKPQIFFFFFRQIYWIENVCAQVEGPTETKISIYLSTVSSTNIGTLDKYEQRQLWK